MAIGRSEDRDNPGDPVVLRHHGSVWGPIRATHLGQRSRRPHHKSLPSRKRGAGHMTAIDQSNRAADTLRAGGRPHMDPGFPHGSSPWAEGPRDSEKGASAESSEWFEHW